jgi:hypothetical protein
MTRLDMREPDQLMVPIAHAHYRRGRSCPLILSTLGAALMLVALVRESLPLQWDSLERC